MVKRTQSKSVSSHSGKLFFLKAEKFLHGAQLMLENRNWESAAALAIHAVISSCDALTAKLLSKRHSGSDHQGIVDLLGELPLRDTKELKSKRAQVRQVIIAKSNVEYDHTLVKPNTARKIVQEAEKIFNWAGKHF